MWLDRIIIKNGKGFDSNSWITSINKCTIMAEKCDSKWAYACMCDARNLAVLGPQLGATVPTVSVWRCWPGHDISSSKRQIVGEIA